MIKDFKNFINESHSMDIFLSNEMKNISIEIIDAKYDERANDTYTFAIGNIYSYEDFIDGCKNLMEDCTGSVYDVSCDTESKVIKITINDIDEKMACEITLRVVYFSEELCDAFYNIN
jgi:hypothetical protein